MRTLITLFPLFIFIILGVVGIFSQDFVQTNNTLYKWFILPATIPGSYYSFALTPNCSKAKGGGIALGRIAITILIFALTFRAAQGYIILFNCNLGSQKETDVSGTVAYVNFPKPKKILDKNSISIVDSSSGKIIALEVPTDAYHVGQRFKKKMLKGSFGILYSPK